MWFSVVCSVIYNDVRYHSCQNVVDSQGAARMVFMKRRRIKDLLQRACVVARTLNMKTSRGRLAHYVKTLHQKACRTCSTICFPHSTNQFIDLWRRHCCCRRQILDSLIAVMWSHFQTRGFKLQFVCPIQLQHDLCLGFLICFTFTTNLCLGFRLHLLTVKIDI